MKTHDFPEITEELIGQWVGEKCAARGKSLSRQHRVLDTQVNEGGSLVLGAVMDTNQQSYSVLIRHLSGQRMKSKCTCSSQHDCRHVAAVLHAILAERKQNNLFDTESDVPVPQAFHHWLGMMGKGKVERPAFTDYPDTVKQRLLFILEPDDDRNVRLNFMSARILKSGVYGKAQPYDPASILTYAPAQFVLASDEKILREVATDRSLSSMHGYRIKGMEGLGILKRIIESERCYWQSIDAPALKRQDRRSGEWRWELSRRGDQHLTLLAGDAEIIVPTLPPWYIDTKSNTCGPVDSGQDADIAEILLNIPAVKLDCSDEVIESVTQQLPEGVPAPVHLAHEFCHVRPVPVVRLKSSRLSKRWGYNTPDHCHVVELLFDYDGKQTSFPAEVESVRIIRGDKVIDYVRDTVCENEAIEALVAAGLSPLSESRLASHFDSPEYTFRLEHDDYWPEWMLYEIPELEAKGFAVEVAEDFAFRVEEATAWDLSLGQDDLTLPGNLMGQASFMVSLDGGDEIDLIDALARWVGEKPEILKSESLARLKEKANVPLPLPNGRLLPVPGEMVASILHFMMDVFTSGGRGEVQLSAPQMLALEESLGQSVVPVRIQSSVWLKEMRQLVDIGNIPVCDVPHSLQAELRDYQREGLNWLQFLRQTGLGGILADDMGLGKTVQALAHILKEKEGGRLQLPVLVIAPTSLMHNWRREAEKFTPGLSVLVLYGPNRARHFGKLMTFDLVLTTYPLLGRDFEVLEAQDWHSLILDEAQYIKNPRAKVAKLVRRLNTENKLCMTGTPMENHLGELWAQFDFLMPGYLHDMRTFSKQFRKPIEIQGDIARQDALNVRLRPFLLRRKKDEVALELPPKMEMVRSIEMEGAQRQLYESVRLAMQKRVRAAVVSMGAAKSQIVVLDALLKMRQVCCDPRLVDGLTGAVPESAKLGMLMEMLPEMIDEGRRVLLFSQFTSMLKLIEAEVSRKNIAYVKMTGQTQDRSAPIESFQEKKVPLFLISLRAGGVGLNLTAADTVIHYDPWWNPAVEAQATDRAHRIGQDKSVFVYKLITEGSVEEKILELQERKRELADAIHQKGAAKRPLWSSEELDALFAPLS